MNSRLITATYWVLLSGCLLIILIYFKDFLQPVVLAVILWYLISSIKNWFRKWKFRNGKRLPSWLASVFSFVLVISVLYGVVSIIQLNVNLIIDKAPFYEKNVTLFVKKVNAFTQGNEEIKKQLDKAIDNLNLQSIFGDILAGISSFLGNFAVVLIYVIFILLEQNLFPRKISTIFPEKQKAERASTLLRKIGEAIDRYFYVKTAISLLTGIMSYIALLFLNVDFPILWAFLIFIFNFVPYVGSFVATLLPALFSIIQFGAFLPFVWVFVVVQSIQILVGNYVEPRIMGSSLNLSPLVVILALAFFGTIWGILGMIISIPVMSIFTIIMAQFQSTRNLAIMLTSNGDLSQTKVDH